MLVYVLSEGFPYEGSSVLGVYDSVGSVVAAFQAYDADLAYADYFYDVFEVGSGLAFDFRSSQRVRRVYLEEGDF